MISQVVAEATIINQVVILRRQLQRQLPRVIPLNPRLAVEPKSQHQAVEQPTKILAQSQDAAKDETLLPWVDAYLNIWDWHRPGGPY